MNGRRKFTRETIRHVAEISGLDTKDAHIEVLFEYVNEHLPDSSIIQDLDLSDVEPALTYVPSEEA
jgi:Asp-tRNA(Asn)/Glu-tRNA(Gln) amidotransferase C subunit